MGTSIYGSVEIKKFDDGFDDWYSIIDVGMALGGDYDVFGCLFGIRNYANFEPLFANRGFPNNFSHDFYKTESWKNVTWCTYQELLNVDLDEKGVLSHQRFELSNGIFGLPENEIQEGKRKYMTRGQALSHPDFQQLMELMSVLAKRYGNDGVRMVVYFD